MTTEEDKAETRSIFDNYAEGKNWKLKARSKLLLYNSHALYWVESNFKNSVSYTCLLSRRGLITFVLFYTITICPFLIHWYVVILHKMCKILHIFFAEYDTNVSNKSFLHSIFVTLLSEKINKNQNPGYV